MSNEIVIGAVGPLQFDLVAFRLDDEYRADCVFETANVYTVRWINGAPGDIEELKRRSGERLALDGGGCLAYLAPTRANLGSRRPVNTRSTSSVARCAVGATLAGRPGQRTHGVGLPCVAATGEAPW